MWVYSDFWQAVLHTLAKTVNHPLLADCALVAKRSVKCILRLNSTFALRRAKCIKLEHVTSFLNKSLRQCYEPVWWREEKELGTAGRFNLGWDWSPLSGNARLTACWIFHNLMDSRNKKEGDIKKVEFAKGLVFQCPYINLLKWSNAISQSVIF